MKGKSSGTQRLSASRVWWKPIGGVAMNMALEPSAEEGISMRQCP